MLTLDDPKQLADHVGKPLDPGAWLAIDQAMINAFADATGDHQWIHVDVDRAKREMPGGKTISHGFFTLSLLPKLFQSVIQVKGRSRTINYGSNKVRFTSMVPVGSRIRLHSTVKSVEPVEGGLRVIFENQIEIEGQTKPALIAETIQVTYL